MTTLLILLSLCSLICSDSLSSFETFVNHDDSDVSLAENVEADEVVHKIEDFGRVTTPSDSLFNGSPKSCADQCLLAKFFCRSFTVVAVYGGIQCIMSNIAAGDSKYFYDMEEGELRAQVIAQFNIEKKIDNVVTISKDPTLVSNERSDKLLQGYGFSNLLDEDKWARMKTFLAACVDALKVPSSKPEDFDEWLGVESTYERPQKRRKTVDTPKSNFLANIDVFIRGVNPNAQTVYDPSKGTLYIHSPSAQLLIILFNDYDYIWAASGLPLGRYNNFVSLGASEDVNPDDILRKTVMDKLVNAAARIGHVLNRLPVFYDINEGVFLEFINRLTGHGLNLENNNEKLILQDLLKIVPILHDKPRMPFTEQNRHSFPFKDVEVFSSEK